jgi:hypothetical protein
LKLKRLLVLLTLILLLSIPALGELTEYQRGVANGLKIGLYMGELHGKSQYSTDYAREFNTYLDSYNQFLLASFGTNQTIINEFLLSPLTYSGINQEITSKTPTTISTTSEGQGNRDIF